jgi:hypothetical protein
MAPTRFEKVLATGLAVPIARAGDRSTRHSKNDEEYARKLLKDAFQRLNNNPGLRLVAPDGAVTYSDPILAIASSWGSIAEEISSAAVEGADLTNASIWKWAITGVQAWVNRRDDGMAELAARVPSGPLSITKDTVRIGIVGDAGYRGVPQQNVIFMMREVHERKPFDLIIHLGDTYFSAGEAEVLRHLLVPFNVFEAPFFTLCGNHDLYHGTSGYLAALKILKQPGRYFLINTPHWRIAALDTSFGSARVLRNDGCLDKAQIEWLQDLLVKRSGKDLILLSHHFIISGWDEPAQSLSSQLGRFVRDRVFAWYWGHEHRCAYYDRGAWGFYGASVGNGAFLEPWTPPTRPDVPVAWYDGAKRCSCSGIRKNTYWPHGFMQIELSKAKLKETYYLEGGYSHSRVLNKGQPAAA